MIGVTQICYSSRDLEATARSMALSDRIGPFFVAEFPLDKLEYRGNPVDYGQLKVAFAYQGSLQIELIETPKDQPSCYEEVLEGRRETLHHIYVKSDEEYDAIIARYKQAGEAVVYHGLAGEGIRFGFIDARLRLGHFIEVLETKRMTGPAAAIFNLYARMEAEARAWDGSRPLRRLAELA